MDLADALGPDNSSVSAPPTNTWPGQPGGAPQWPGQPGQPGGAPQWPGQPGQPGAPPQWPGQPGGAPQWPGGPGQPGAPQWPGGPGQPGAPQWPGGPGQPGGAPQWPGGPGQPGGAPQWPGGPGQPGEAPQWPGGPGQPGAPQWPGGPGQPGQPGAPGGWPAPSPATGPGQSFPTAPQTPLVVPYRQQLPGGIFDKLLITIMGKVKPNPNMFTIDFTTPQDVAFHINPRFNEGGKRAIVRNSEVGKRWGKEEREHTNFPFSPGQDFEMKILCTQNAFKVAVNKNHLFEFLYRIRNLRDITTMAINGDIFLSAVRLETMP